MANVVPPVPLHDIKDFPYTIQEWLRKVQNAINGSAGSSILFTSLNFTGSNITSILTRNHDDLQNIFGGTSGQFYHLTSAEHTTVQTLTSGTYTPTLTAVANVDASTAYTCQYMRVGSVVTVSGKLDIDVTTGSTSTQLGISLPIASNIAAQENVGGTAFASGVFGFGGAIRGDATNDRAELVMISNSSTANQSMYFSFTYRII